MSCHVAHVMSVFIPFLYLFETCWNIFVGIHHGIIDTYTIYVICDVLKNGNNKLGKNLARNNSQRPLPFAPGGQDFQKISIKFTLWPNVISTWWQFIAKRVVLFKLPSWPNSMAVIRCGWRSFGKDFQQSSLPRKPKARLQQSSQRSWSAWSSCWRLWKMMVLWDKNHGKTTQGYYMISPDSI